MRQAKSVVGSQRSVVASVIRHSAHSPARSLSHFLTCGVVCALSTIALTAAAPDNPYADTIVGRNVFSLKSPPPPPNPEDLIKKDPPPKILLQGLTTILGRRQVLFKVQIPAKPGQPAKEESYVLTEGERQGEIEVLEINEKTEPAVVKFNNHGTIEPLNMKEHVAKATAIAPPPPGLPQPGRPVLPGIPPPTAAVNPVRPGPSAVTTFGGSRQIPTRTLRTPTTAAAGGPAGYGAGQATQTTPAAPPLNREEQAVMIELQREIHRDTDISKLLPPTPLTPPAPK
jgi:hypothetical protein